MSVLPDSGASYFAIDKLKVEFGKHLRATKTLFIVGCTCAHPKYCWGSMSLGV